MLTREQLEAARPMLEALPYAVLQVTSTYEVEWHNAEARAVYDVAAVAKLGRSPTCHRLSHHSEQPCHARGEACPLEAAVGTGRPASVNHVHPTTHGLECFKVTAVPLSGGGVLEFHVALTEDVTQDPVTGLLVRAFFESVLQRQVALLDRLAQPWSALILDVDELKLINDRFGHHAGDEALAAVGAAVRKLSRQSDASGRWGGDELAILISADGAGSKLLAERLLNAVRATRLPGNSSLQLSVSIGLAAASKGEPWAQVLQRADDALYRAKTAGRNCVVLAEPAP